MTGEEEIMPGDGSEIIDNTTDAAKGLIDSVSDWFWALPTEYQFIVVGAGCVIGYIILDRLIFHKIKWVGKKRC